MPSASSSPIVVIRVAGRPRSEPDRDGDVADLAQDLGARRAPPAMEQQVDRRVADAQVRERHLAEPVRQVRVAQLQLAAVGVGPQARASSRGTGTTRRPPTPAASRRPDTGRASRRLLAVEAAEQLRQAVVGEVLGRLEDVADQPVRLVVEAVALEAGRDQRRVVRPDRARCGSRSGCSRAGPRRRSGSPSPRTSPARAAGRRRRAPGPARRSRSRGTARRSSRSRRPARLSPSRAIA